MVQRDLHAGTVVHRVEKRVLLHAVENTRPTNAAGQPATGPIIDDRGGEAAGSCRGRIQSGVRSRPIKKSRKFSARGTP